MYPDYSFDSNYIKVPGGRIHYVDEGKGPVILMVHGNPTWSYYYRHLIARLSKHFRVVAVDNIGCGLSDKPQNYSYRLADHVANLEALIDALNVKRFSLVVHDWGGAIGFGAAANDPTRIEKIVVLNTAAFRSKMIPFRINICRQPVIGEIIVRLFNGFAWPATFMAVANRLDPKVAQAYLAPYDNWKNRIAVHRFVKDIPLDEEHQSYRTLLNIEDKLSTIRELNPPMVIIWGGKDFCFNDTFFDEWQKRFPEAKEHYFDDAGHYVLEDKRNEILDICEEFFGN